MHMQVKLKAFTTQFIYICILYAFNIHEIYLNSVQKYILILYHFTIYQVFNEHVFKLVT